MSYWKSKVVPKIKKLFDKGKKKGAAEACKNFDKSKESIDKEIGEKTPDLQPKIVEIYRSSTVITKKLLKEPSEPAVKDNSDAVKTVLQELSKAGFPGAQLLCEAESKFGSALLPGPIVYLFEKTSTFLVEEPLPEAKEETREIAVEDIKAEASAEEPPKEEEKKEEEKVEEISSKSEEPKEEEKKEQEVKVEEKKEEVKAEEKKDEKKEEVKEEVKNVEAPLPPAPAVETATSKESPPLPPPAAVVAEKPVDPPAPPPEKVDPAPIPAPTPAPSPVPAPSADPVAAPPPAKTDS